MNLITLTVHSTHFYLIDCQGGKLLVDAGWELNRFLGQLQQVHVPINTIRYVMFTHHHPDHAGLVQNIKNLSGARLIIHEKQIPFLTDLARYYDKKGGYEPIRVDKRDLISPDRETLQSIGISGEIVETPGHSPDSISLVIDQGAAFIGDLPWLEFVDAESIPTVSASWKNLLRYPVQRFYHSHADPIPAARVRTLFAD